MVVNLSQSKRALVRSLALLLALAPLSACQSAPPSPYRWTEFVTTRGHANPIPKSWVATPEGRFAHELVIPNPVPADSGYQSSMNAAEYYRHLCDTEAGDFIFKKVDNVEGLYFARPPKSPSDQDLMDRWKLEHPRLESKFQLLPASPTERALLFIHGERTNYRFYEEPNQNPQTTALYLGLSGYKSSTRDKNFNIVPGRPWHIEQSNELKSQYGLTWRGILRPHDREHGIAGGEIIAYDLTTLEILAVFRNFAFSGRTKNTLDGVWWLTSAGCRQLHHGSDAVDAGLRRRSSSVLIPAK